MAARCQVTSVTPPTPRLQEVQSSGVLTAQLTVHIARAGRYIVRATASALNGAVASMDLPIIIRKRGDNLQEAACCRNTAMVVAGQEGRPIHATDLRHTRTEALKSELGWGAAYISSEQEIESERLFNYGMLAPPLDTPLLEVFTCFDSRMAGAGSPRVEQARRPELIGHGKRLWVTTMVRTGGEICVCLRQLNVSPADRRIALTMTDVRSEGLQLGRFSTKHFGSESAVPNSLDWDRHFRAQQSSIHGSCLRS
jgi:hypothetical protein